VVEKNRSTPSISSHPHTHLWVHPHPPQLPRHIFPLRVSRERSVGRARRGGGCQEGGSRPHQGMSVCALCPEGRDPEKCGQVAVGSIAGGGGGRGGVETRGEWQWGWAASRDE
jgi:hypothetical protein